MTAEQITSECILDDLIQAAWHVIASDFDETVFQRWRRKALSCALSLCGPDHSATLYFMKRTTPAPRRDTNLSLPVVEPDVLKSFRFVALFEDEHRSIPSEPLRCGAEEENRGGNKSFEGGSTQACSEAFAGRLHGMGTGIAATAIPHVESDKKSCLSHHRLTFEGNSTSKDS